MIEIDISRLKNILAEVAEGTYDWGDTYSYFRYSRLNSLLRNVSPNHEGALLHYTEKFALHFIASSLPDNCIMLEIGSCLGGSASILAHANKTLTIYAVDDFDQNFKYSHVREGTPRNVGEEPNELPYWTPFDKRVEKIFGPNKQRTIETVREWVCSKYPNVHFYKGKSPYDFYNSQLANKLDKQLDVLFQDGAHSDPVLKDDLDFWLSKLKEGGLLLMHDYRPWLPKRFQNYVTPDVDKNISCLISQNQVELLGSVRSIAIMRKIK